MKRFKLIILTVVLIGIFLIIEVVIVRSASQYEPKLNVIFIKADIPANTVIGSDMLEERPVGLSSVHRQSVRNIGDVVGKVAKVDLLQGEMLLSSRLADGDLEMLKVKDGSHRLFSVEFQTDQANGWWLKTDQHVDIIFIPEGGKSTEKPESIPEGIVRLRNIRIAALIDEQGKIIRNGQRTTPPRYISFEVTDKQDEFLAYAKGNGRLEISVIPEGNAEVK